MTRRLAQHQPRRLLRMRPAIERPPHGLALALPALRVERRADPEPAQRADQRALRALGDENALLARELGRVQARCTRWRDDCIAQAERLEALLMRARGDLIVKQTELAVLRDAQGVPGGARSVAAPSLPAVPALAGRRVLCVGGRARQVPIYREIVERGGGRFAHVDGLAAEGLAGLRRALAEADLVILQPRYICRGACETAASHCARLGIRCVQLDKACVLGFACCLKQAIAVR